MVSTKYKLVCESLQITINVEMGTLEILGTRFSNGLRSPKLKVCSLHIFGIYIARSIFSVQSNGLLNPECSRSQTWQEYLKLF